MFIWAELMSAYHCSSVESGGESINNERTREGGVEGISDILHGGSGMRRTTNPVCTLRTAHGSVRFGAYRDASDTYRGSSVFGREFPSSYSPGRSRWGAWRSLGDEGKR